MPDPSSLSPAQIARHLSEARDLRGAAIRKLFASAAQPARATVRTLAETTRARLHRRRLVFAPRLACQ